MNRLRLIIPTLIQINVVVAILSVVFVIIMREQQAQITTSTQESLEQPNSQPRQIKDKISVYQQKIYQNHQKIQSYEQQLKGLKAELEEYKSQNTLLMRFNSSKSPKITAVDSSRTPQLTTASSVNSKKQTSNKSVKSGSTSPIAQSKPSVIPVESLKIASNLSNLQSSQQARTNSRTQSAPNYQPQLPMASAEKVEREEKKMEANRDRENRINDNNNDIIAMNQIANPQKVSPNSSQTEISDSFISSAVPALPLDSNRDISIHYANTVSHGLAIAADKGQINPKTQMYRQVQTAIALLRKGESMQEATRKAQVPEKVIDQLVKWGEKRPGSLLKVAEGK